MSEELGMISGVHANVGRRTLAADAGGPTNAKLAELLARLTAARAAFLDAAVSTRASAADYTAARAALLDRLDVVLSTRATPTQVNAEVDSRLNTAVPASPVADSLYERVRTLDENYTSTRAALIDRLDAALSTRATPADVDAQVNARLGVATPAAPTAGSVYAELDDVLARLTATRAANLDKLDANVTTRAAPSDVDAQVHSRLGVATPAAPTAGSIYDDLDQLLARLTSARAANLDAAVSTRASAAEYTAARAGNLDNLNGLVHRRRQNNRISTYITRDVTGGSPGAWAEVTANFGFDAEVYGIDWFGISGGAGHDNMVVELATGAAGAESIFFSHYARTTATHLGGQNYHDPVGFRGIHEPRLVASGTRLAARAEAPANNYRVVIYYSRA